MKSRARICLFKGFRSTFWVNAGPFEDIPSEGIDFSVCLAPEINMKASLVSDIADFGIPENPEAFVAAMEEVVVRAIRGEEVYIGCKGGLGRTGTALATMAKLCGSEEPVKYVRCKYHPHAVETSEQEKFVQELDVYWARIRIWIRVLAYTTLGVSL